MDKGGKTFTPECFGKACFIQHCSNALTKHSISPLSNSILLGPVPSGVLPQNTAFLSKFEECIRQYSPPLSSLKILIFLSDWFSAKALNVLNASKTLDLALIGSTKRNLE